MPAAAEFQRRPFPFHAVARRFEGRHRTRLPALAVDDKLERRTVLFDAPAMLGHIHHGAAEGEMKRRDDLMVAAALEGIAHRQATGALVELDGPDGTHRTDQPVIA